VRLPPISFDASNGTSACAHSESRRPSHVNQLPNTAPITVGAVASGGGTERARPSVKWRCGWWQVAHAVWPESLNAAVEEDAPAQRDRTRIVGDAIRRRGRQRALEAQRREHAQLARAPRHRLVRARRECRARERGGEHEGAPRTHGSVVDREREAQAVVPAAVCTSASITQSPTMFSFTPSIR
jgi:hypothetical protein